MLYRPLRLQRSFCRWDVRPTKCLRCFARVSSLYSNADAVQMPSDEHRSLLDGVMHVSYTAAELQAWRTCSVAALVQGVPHARCWLDVYSNSTLTI
jgi:hypothetical protein